MTWSDLLDGCRVLATLNGSGDAYATIRDSVVSQLVKDKGYGIDKANQLLDDIIKEIREGKSSR
jgi:hypothetical protein